MSTVFRRVEPDLDGPTGYRLSPIATTWPDAEGLFDYVERMGREFPELSMLIACDPEYVQMEAVGRGLPRNVGGLLVGWVGPDRSTEFHLVWCYEDAIAREELEELHG